MAAVVHTWPELKTKPNCQIRQNCQIGQKFLLTVGGGKRLVGCWQLSLASNSKANGLNKDIPSQVWCTLLCWTSWYYWGISKNWFVYLQRLVIWSRAKGVYVTILDCLCLYSFWLSGIHTIETETASDSLHDIRGWRKLCKNLGIHVINLLQKKISMIKRTGFDF
jgi:hypothetical protein